MVVDAFRCKKYANYMVQNSCYFQLYELRYVTLLSNTKVKDSEKKEQLQTVYEFATLFFLISIARLYY